MKRSTKIIAGVAAGIAGVGAVWLFIRRKKGYNYAAAYPEIKGIYDTNSPVGIVSVTPPPTPAEAEKPSGIFGVTTPYFPD